MVAVDLETAKGHLEVGRNMLERADSLTGEGRIDDAASISAHASAHFMASMAITNVLLTEPAEWAGPLLSDPVE